MLRIVSIVVLSLFYFLGNAQSPSLFAKNEDGKLYLDHKVAPKESLYALGRLYNVSAKYLAAYNKIDISKGLQIDQKLKIPLTDTNFTQSEYSGTPIYYKVGDKEGLSAVSRKNNEVPINDLRNWNKLSTDVIQKDANLIVGFLKGSGFKKVTIAAPATVNVPPVTTTKNVLRTDEPVAVVVNDNVKSNARNENNLPDTKPVAEAIAPKTSAVLNESYFKDDYYKQVQLSPVSVIENVNAGIFKTTSGWQDYKYYLLADKVAPGTIVKLTNPNNDKVVFAKVLGEMSGIRQNAGLQIRISNAAAAALGNSENDQFIISITY
ncbi:MAG: hypothetical protein RIR12_217 [Bacteroidota bacterium]|jgi:LysM repeat protein